MKKTLALVLGLMMVFSVVTFAEGEYPIPEGFVYQDYHDYQL